MGETSAIPMKLWQRCVALSQGRGPAQKNVLKSRVFELFHTLAIVLILLPLQLRADPPPIQHRLFAVEVPEGYVQMPHNQALLVLVPASGARRPTANIIGIPGSFSSEVLGLNAYSQETIQSYAAVGMRDARIIAVRSVAVGDHRALLAEHVLGSEEDTYAWVLTVDGDGEHLILTVIADHSQISQGRELLEELLRSFKPSTKRPETENNRRPRLIIIVVIGVLLIFGLGYLMKHERNAPIRGDR